MSRAAEQVVLEPSAARLAEAMRTPPRLHQLGPDDGRAAFEEMQDDDVAGPGVLVRWRRLRVARRDVRVAVIAPARGAGPRPAVVYAHGGRWILGSAATHGALVRELAVRSAAVLIVPEYTRSPDARFPVALDEVYAVAVWASSQSTELGIDSDRIAVAGDGVGATLATATALLAARRGGPDLCAQVLLCPWADPRGRSGSYEQFVDDPVLGALAARWSWEQYAAEAADLDALDDPLFAPLRARPEGLTGMPPALVVSAEVDVLRDEAEAYAQLLREAGVPVAALRFLGTVHDFVSLRAMRHSSARRWALREASEFLGEAFTGRRRQAYVTSESGDG